jgi:type IV pilus assembly protein PilQ
MSPGMNTQTIRTFRITVPAWLARCGAAVLMTLAAGAAAAQGNAIESITANQQGANVVLNIAMREAPAKPPIGFSITNPARIALDFGATSNATGKTSQDINLGDVRSLNVVQAGARTRLVLNMARALNYATAIDGKSVIVTVEGSGGVAQAVNASGMPVVSSAPAAPGAKQLLRDLDFRRGSNGEGRVVVDLPNGQVGVDVRQAGNQVIVDFLRTGLPETLRRRLDVTDFGTPVSRITTATQGENVRMTIDAQGAWEQSVYQSDTQLIVDVRPVKEDPNRPGGNASGYRGEKLSFNFQNVEVRAALQAIADISNLNIIASDRSRTAGWCAGR